MSVQPATVLPVRRPSNIDGGRRGVRLPAGTDSKLFGGWGIRF